MKLYLLLYFILFCTAIRKTDFNQTRFSCDDYPSWPGWPYENACNSPQEMAGELIITVVEVLF